MTESGTTPEAYADPKHPGNSSKHHTGKPCVIIGCDKPAGTAWSPYWCFRHNVERIDRVGRQLNEVLDAFKDQRSGDRWSVR